MTVKERIHSLVEELPPEKWEEVERLLCGLKVPQEPAAALSPEEREARIGAILAKHRAGQAIAPEEREELLALGRGMSAHAPGSVDAFLREKHEETEREEARFGRHYQERAA